MKNMNPIHSKYITFLFSVFVLIIVPSCEFTEVTQGEGSKEQNVLDTENARNSGQLVQAHNLKKIELLAYFNFHSKNESGFDLRKVKVTLLSGVNSAPFAKFSAAQALDEPITIQYPSNIINRRVAILLEHREKKIYQEHAIGRENNLNLVFNNLLADKLGLK